MQSVLAGCLLNRGKPSSQKPTQTHTSAIIFLNSKSKQISSLALSSKHDLIRHFIPRIQECFFEDLNYGCESCFLCAVRSSQPNSGSSTHKISFPNSFALAPDTTNTRAGGLAALGSSPKAPALHAAGITQTSLVPFLDACF